MSTIALDDDVYYRTQFDDGEQRLLYSHVTGTQVGYKTATGRRGEGRKVDFWCFFWQDADSRPRKVGLEYPSKETLLADMHRYGTECGF
jgi:hypothetical protein